MQAFCSACSGGAGSGTNRSLGQRLTALLRGRKASADTIAVEGVTASHIAQAAQLTEGFSGRELAKLMASMQVRWRACNSCFFPPSCLLCPVQRKLKCCSTAVVLFLGCSVSRSAARWLIHQGPSGLAGVDALRAAIGVKTCVTLVPSMKHVCMCAGCGICQQGSSAHC